MKYVAWILLLTGCGKWLPVANVSSPSPTPSAELVSPSESRVVPKSTPTPTPKPTATPTPNPWQDCQTYGTQQSYTPNNRDFQVQIMPLKCNFPPTNIGSSYSKISSDEYDVEVESLLSGVPTQCQNILNVAPEGASDLLCKLNFSGASADVGNLVTVSYTISASYSLAGQTTQISSSSWTTLTLSY